MIQQPNAPYDEKAVPVPVPTGDGPVGTSSSETEPSTNPGRDRTRTTGRIIALCAVVGLLVVATDGIVGAAPTNHSASSSSRATPTSSSGTSQGPAAKPSSLSALLIQPRDTTPKVSVHLLPGGDQVNGQPTLDVCNRTFASESQRTARLQDVAIDTSGTLILSTEAVLYRNAAATKQAFEELRKVAASCPKGPVTSPVTGSPITTTFHTPPDGAWPNTASVEREVLSLTTVDAKGASADSVAVYLRRGRVLLGIYFSKPNTPLQPAIAGHTKLAGIAAAFATRLAELPASFVADSPA